MSKRISRSVAIVAATVAVSMTAAGCGMTVQNLPLPKPGVKGDSYELHAVFQNALNLPQRAHVKVGGSDVGVVTGITTSNFNANVDMKIQKDIQLPKGTTAELRQATPLGDVFIAMSMPKSQPGDAMLKDGDTIGLDKTSAGATVEELMISVSMLLNGGGLNQLIRTASELDGVVKGRGPQLSHLLAQLTSTMTGLNSRTTQINSVLDQTDGLLANLNQRKAELGAAADALPPMIGVIAENNKAIGDLVNKLSVTTAALGDFSNTESSETKSLLDNVDKLMSGIAQAGDNLNGALNQINEISPKAVNSMRGNSLAVGATVAYLNIGALTDPQGSRLPDGSDVTGFIGSLTQVLQHVLSRLQGGHR